MLGQGGDLSVTEIAERVGMVGRSTVSSHLRILRAFGVVGERRDGRHRRYALDPEGSVRDAFRFLHGLLESGVRLDAAVLDPVDAGVVRDRATGG